MKTENKIKIMLEKNEIDSFLERYETSLYAGNVSFNIEPDSCNDKYTHLKLFWITFNTNDTRLSPSYAMSLLFSAGVHHGKKPQ